MHFTTVSPTETVYFIHHPRLCLTTFLHPPIKTPSRHCDPDEGGRSNLIADNKTVSIHKVDCVVVLALPIKAGPYRQVLNNAHTNFQPSPQLNPTNSGVS